MSRFDNRTKETFKKDIKFGTMLESYWWNRWFDQAVIRTDLQISSPKDNGCGNDGEFIESGNTSGADYMADVDYEGRSIKNCPIEIKWVPTAGKFTLKESDLKAYVRENAAIIFIYNSVKCGTDLRKPKDYDFDTHIAKIEERMSQMRWGLMWPDKVKKLYESAEFTPIKYMGWKQGVVLDQSEFGKYFTEEKWN